MTLSTCSSAESPRTRNPAAAVPLWAGWATTLTAALPSPRRVTVNSKHLSDLVPHEFCGEIAILRDCMCTATVVAQSPATVVALPRAVFHALVDSSPAVRLRPLAGQGEPPSLTRTFPPTPCGLPSHLAALQFADVVFSAVSRRLLRSFRLAAPRLLACVPAAAVDALEPFIGLEQLPAMAGIYSVGDESDGSCFAVNQGVLAVHHDAVTRFASPAACTQALATPAWRVEDGEPARLQTPAEVLRTVLRQADKLRRHGSGGKAAAEGAAQAVPYSPAGCPFGAMPPPWWTGPHCPS